MSLVPEQRIVADGEEDIWHMNTDYDENFERAGLKRPRERAMREKAWLGVLYDQHGHGPVVRIYRDGDRNKPPGDRPHYQPRQASRERLGRLMERLARKYATGFVFMPDGIQVMLYLSLSNETMD